jgi:hypothetical protein
LASVNRWFAKERRGQSQVDVPSVATRPQVFHGGLLHPGEPPPRSVPDVFSLRLRLVMHAPYPSIITAILLLHRLQPEGFSLRKVRGRWVIGDHPKRSAELLATLDAFALDRGWVVSRNTRLGLDAQQVLAVLGALGIVALLSNRAVLDDRFFYLLRTDAEHMEVHRVLQPLTENLGLWLETNLKHSPQPPET